MRIALGAAVACLSLIGIAAAGDVQASIKKQINIPAQPLSSALETLAKERDFQIMYVSGELEALATQGVSGELTVDEALTGLLEGSGHSFRYVDEKTVTILPVATAPASAPAKNDAALGSVSSTQYSAPASRSFWSRFRLSQAESASTSEKLDEIHPELQEIVVTAQKKGEERLQDVPIPITAIQADTLVSGNQLRLQDYYATVPGLGITSGGARGEAFPNIRGIADSEYATPTVGILVDDIPYQSSAGAQGGTSMAPDIDPNDLARVEVLRGPQGTLYGASSMGGLINYVTVDPSTDGIGGSLQVGSTSVSHGGGIGFNVRGAVNVPLSDALAVRVSAFTRREPGYVDNHFFGDPEHGIGKDVNQTDAHGGRLSALWKPSDGFSLKLSAQLQTLKTDASPYVTLRSGLGDLQQSVLRGEGWLNRDARAYSATIKAKLGRVDLTSVSGYNEGPLRSTYDFSPTVGPCCSQPIFGVTGAVSHNSVKADNFSQEIRLSAQLGERMDWVVGGFYTHQKSTFVGNIIAVDSASGSSPGSVLFDHTGPQKYEESAVFANLTYQVTDRLDVQFGGRQSRNRQSFAQELSGILFCPTADPADPACAGYVDGTFFSPANQSSSSVSDNSFTYLVTPRLKLSRDLMVYARLASGYRPGWTNGSLASAFGYPSEVEHDTTTNYEVGVKGAILDHALYFDASVYYIDWKDIPVFITDPVSFFGYGANAGGAKSQGMELSVTAKPMRTLSIAAWAAWNVAELTQDLPAGAPGASSGDRLPFSSRFSGYLTLDQEFALTSSITGFLGGSVSYTSNRKGNFGASPLFGGNGERQTYPGYAKADVRVGARYDSWTINLFVNNVTDKRAEIGGGLGGFFGPNSFVLIQPLTVGLSLSKSFD